MAKLRNTIINQILVNLEMGYFLVEDFDIQFPDNSSILAEIIFKALPQYKFILDEASPSRGPIGHALALTGQASETNKVLRTRVQPGEYKNSENEKHENINSAVQSVSDWVHNIHEDIINSKINVTSTIDEFTEDFLKKVDENIDNPESYFEKNEEDELKQKLDELQARVSELESKLNISPDDTKKIKEVIDKSKTDLKVYPKGVWYKTAGTKIIRVIKEVLKSKEGREILSDLAKKFIS